MQLLLLFLLLSAQGEKFKKDMQPLLETIGGENLKTAISEAEALAEVFELAKTLTPAADSRTQKERETDYPFYEISPFADPDIVAALNEFIGSA